jgi:hypothetical protein
MHVRLGGLFSVAFVAAMLAACTGGGSGTDTNPIIPTPGPATAYTQVASLTTAGGSLTFGSVGTSSAGISSAKVTLSTLSAAGSVTGTLSSSLPAGVTAPASVRRPATLGVTNTPLAYISLTFAQNETLYNSPAVSVTFASAPAAGSAYLVVYSSALPNGWNIVSGPITISGTTLSFSSALLTPPISFTANTPYIFAIVSTAGVIPTSAPSLAYSYTGSVQQNTVYAYPSGSPFPSTSNAATITEAVSFGASPAPNATPATDVHAVITTNGQLSSATTNSDTWIGVSGSQLLEFASASNDGVTPTADTLQTIYSAPAQIDTVPEVAATWTNQPGKTVNEADADGTTDARTVATNGTYLDTQTEPYGSAGTAFNIVSGTNTDGSGTMLGTQFSNLYGIGGFGFTAPAAGAITVNILDVTSTPALPVVDGTLATPAAWFTPSPTLSSETDALTAGVTYPAGCNVPSLEGTSGNEIVQTISTLDPILGYTEVETTSTYTSPSYGPVCIQLGDVQTYYYDYLDDTAAAVSGFADYVGTTLSTVTTNETLTLQSAAGTSVTVFDTGRKSATAIKAQTIPVLAAKTQFDAFLAKQRTSRMKSLIANMKRYAATRGGKLVK